MVAAPFALTPVNFAAGREEAHPRREAGEQIFRARPRPRPEN